MNAESYEEELLDYKTYHIGEAITDYIPSEKEVKNMLRLVAYDICSASRLRRVAKWCEDYGVRIEKSVFGCDLSQKDFDIFWAGVNRIIDDSEDSLIAYRVCQSCVRDIKSSGVIERPTKRLAYIF